MGKHRVVVVDDDPTILDYCATVLEGFHGITVEPFSTAEEAVLRIEANHCDLVISDLKMPDMDGLGLIEAVQLLDSEIPIVILTGVPDVETAVECMKAGASEYLTKPIRIEELKLTVKRLLKQHTLRQENSLLRRQLEKPFKGVDQVIGEGPAIKKMLEVVRLVSVTNLAVLISGETGTGKELLARRVHAESPRRDQRFVPVNCGAIPENLAESELFGHERGAFTGANKRKLGLIEYADGGTLFLDEIGELPPAIQTKFLRVIQDKCFRRLGSQEEIAVDVRVVAATNRDLKTEVESRRFRSDLYYRLNVMPLALPPLRDRPEDLAQLIRYFIDRATEELGLPRIEADEDFLRSLHAYRWPGNIRELQNLMKRVVVLSAGAPLRADLLPDVVFTELREGLGDAKGFLEQRDRRMRAFERSYFQSLLEQSGGAVKTASKESGLPPATLYRWLKRCGLKARDFLPPKGD